MESVKTTVLAAKRWSEREILLWLDAPDLCNVAKAGQFVMVSAIPSTTFLKKAISIHAVKDGKLGIAVQAVGPGTEALFHLNTGDGIAVIGPLGNGFDTDIENAKIMVIGGGIGKAPLRLLCEELIKKGNQILLICGGRDAVALAGLEWADAMENVSVRLMSEDGSVGDRGFVTDAMGEIESFSRVYACGPTPMLQAVQQLACTYHIPCQLSLEGKMACGVGVCLGCTCKRHEDDAPYAKVCTDGPVFWAEEVRLDG